MSNNFYDEKSNIDTEIQSLKKRMLNSSILSIGKFDENSFQDFFTRVDVFCKVISENRNLASETIANALNYIHECYSSYTSFMSGKREKNIDLITKSFGDEIKRKETIFSDIVKNEENLDQQIEKLFDRANLLTRKFEEKKEQHERVQNKYDTKLSNINDSYEKLLNEIKVTLMVEENFANDKYELATFDAKIHYNNEMSKLSKNPDRHQIEKETLESWLDHKLEFLEREKNTIIYEAKTRFEKNKNIIIDSKNKLLINFSHKENNIDGKPKLEFIDDEIEMLKIEKESVDAWLKYFEAKSKRHEINSTAIAKEIVELRKQLADNLSANESWFASQMKKAAEYFNESTKRVRSAECGEYQDPADFNKDMPNSWLFNDYNGFNPTFNFDVDFDFDGWD